MKIGILTFHAAHNYGSMLQAYALQNFLRQEGHQPEFINFRSPIQKLMYTHPFDFRYVYKIKETIYNLLHNPGVLLPQYRRWRLFEKFMNGHIKLSHEYSTPEELKDTTLDYDLIIVGSDQVWNTNAHDFNIAYLAGFTKVRRISYAASLGGAPEVCNSTLLCREISDFDSVTVREERSKAFLEEKCGLSNVNVVLDPVLLLGIEPFLSLVETTPIVGGDYMFYYTPQGYGDNIDKALELGNILGLEVITDKRYKGTKGYKVAPPMGPIEFLNVIKHAKFVCGQSFHLLAFAILFHKDFCCLGDASDSRLNSLTKKLGLSHRIVGNGNFKALLKQSPIDYLQIESLLDMERERSISILRDMLVGNNK